MTQIFDENTLARATVRGVPNVFVLRRKTQVGYDWAHSLIAGFTCSNDNEVSDVRVLAIGPFIAHNNRE